MKTFKKITVLCLSMFIAAGLFSCKTEDDGNDPFTGITITVDSASSTPGGEIKVTPVFYNADVADNSVSITLAIITDSTNGASFSATTVTSGSSSTLTLGESSGTVTFTATYGSYSKSMTVSAGSSVISASDTPTGYAALGSYSATRSKGTVKVSTRSDLVKYAKEGGYIIYVNGMIDMSGGRLPEDNTDSTGKLSSFISEYTDGTYKTWTAWRTAFANACTTSSDNTTSDSTINSYHTELYNKWKDQIQLNVASNTTIIGLDSESGIKGGTVVMSKVSNIIIRNLTIQDAFDPFPHHEKDDGYNAQYDAIGIQDTSSNIWIDHCTLKDTMDLAYVKTGGSTSEKWQTYDGLLDIKGDSAYITVSYCKFTDHDKTSLIGSSKTDGDNSKRLITYHHNYFYNCGQRLPMVRNTTLHLYNNYYNASNPEYSQQYAVGVRENAIIYAENNYFGSGIRYSFKDSDGTLYSSGNTDKSSSGCNSTTSVSRLFSSAVGAYTYTVDSASDVPSLVQANAGAGMWSVSK